MQLIATLLVLTVMLPFRKASAKPLEVGDSAPVVTGVTHEGVKLDLGDVYSRGYTLVYFYPKTDTPGCTAQGCSLRDAYEELGEKGVTVIGVSTDGVEAQKKFRAKHHLPFTLIADSAKAVVHAFRVPTTFGFASRQAFLSSYAILRRQIARGVHQRFLLGDKLGFVTG